MFAQLEKHFMLQELDRLWKEHLANMDFLRQGIHFRGYAQKNPKQEYKREAFEMFRDMLSSLKVSVIQMLMIVEIRRTEEVQALEAEQQALAAALQQQSIAQHPSPDFQIDDASTPFFSQEGAQGDEKQQATPEPFQREQAKVGRNENCPCGSGKKFKHCHGALD